MSLRISKSNAGYTAKGVLAGVTFEADVPLSARELVQWLQNQGFHQTDIGDAFFEADPNWLSRLETEN